MAESLTKNRILEEAKREVEEEIGKKYKAEYKGLLKDKATAELVVGNIDRQIKELELKIEQEIGTAGQ